MSPRFGPSPTHVFLRTAALLVIALASVPLHAWGPRGHEIVAEIAARELSPRARAEVENLLGDRAGPGMREASTWADDLRAWPGVGISAPLHYVNMPRGSCRYRAARDCRRSRCVVGAIERFADELARPGATEARRDALRWVIHLVADVHQPLHAGYADDRGGNDLQVRFDNEGTNLHALLDSGLLRKRNLRAVPYAERLLAAAPRPAPDASAWSEGAAARWAEESCALVPNVYPNAERIDPAYAERVTTLLESRLLRGGRRLATLLNAVLDPASAARAAR